MATYPLHKCSLVTEGGFSKLPAPRQSEQKVMAVKLNPVMRNLYTLQDIMNNLVLDQVSDVARTLQLVFL